MGYKPVYLSFSSVAKRANYVPCFFMCWLVAAAFHPHQKANALSLSHGFICLTFTICLRQVPYIDDDNVCAGLVTRCSFLPMWSLSSAWELILMYLAPGDLLPPLDTMWVGYDGRMGVLFVSLFLDIDWCSVTSTLLLRVLININSFIGTVVRYN